MRLRGKARQLKTDGKAEEAVTLIKQTYNPAVTAYLKTLRDFVELQQSTAQTRLAEMACA